MHIRWSTVFAFVVAVGLMTPSRFVLAQDDPGPVCMDDMEPGVVQPIVFDAWLGGGAATNFPTNGTRINGMVPATVSISTDWKYYQNSDGQIMKWVRTWGTVPVTYTTSWGAAATRGWTIEKDQVYVCRFDANNNQSWVLYDDYQYESIYDEYWAPKIRTWSNTGNETIYYSALHPTFVDTDGTVKPNKSKQTLMFVHNSTPGLAAVPIGAPPQNQPVYPTFPGGVGWARGTNTFTDQYGTGGWEDSYTQSVVDDNPPNQVASAATFDYAMAGWDNKGPTGKLSFHRDFDPATGIFNVSETGTGIYNTTGNPDGDTKSGQLIWKKGVTWNYLDLLNDESSYQNICAENPYGMLTFEFLDGTSWLMFWNADPGLAQ